MRSVGLQLALWAGSRGPWARSRGPWALSHCLPGWLLWGAAERRSGRGEEILPSPFPGYLGGTNNLDSMGCWKVARFSNEMEVV